MGSEHDHHDDVHDDDLDDHDDHIDDHGDHNKDQVEKKCCRWEFMFCKLMRTRWPRVWASRCFPNSPLFNLPSSFSLLYFCLFLLFFPPFDLPLSSFSPQLLLIFPSASLPPSITDFLNLNLSIFIFRNLISLLPPLLQNSKTLFTLIEYFDFQVSYF